MFGVQSDSMLTNKIAVVTGGSRGIGFSITQELLTQNAKVVICSRNSTQLKYAIKKLKKSSIQIFGIVADVSRLSDCKKLISFANKKLGPVDILVNNAGIFGSVGSLETNDPKLWLNTIKTNLLSMVYCSQLVIPSMKNNKRGKIINLCGAGVGSANTLPHFSAYYTSKGAVAAFTEVLSAELIDHNIEVNAISPGGVNTTLTDQLIKIGPLRAGKHMYSQALKQKQTGGTPPGLAAEMVSFLASDEANHLTGRLLSANWNSIKDLKKTSLPKNLYKLRRIDNFTFYEKNK